MARPSPTTAVQEELYASVAPLADQDAANNWALLIYSGAIASMFDQIEGYVRDQPDGTPGWGILMDVNRVPYEALAWLGQFVGVDLTNAAKLYVPSGSNMITPNPNGEATTGWTAFGGTGLVSVALPSGSAPVDAGTATALRSTGDGGGLAGAYHVVSGLTAGQTYLASIDVFPPGAGLSTSLFVLDDSTGLEIVGTSHDTRVSAALAWQQRFVAFTAPASGAVRIAVQGTGTTGQLWYFTRSNQQRTDPESDVAFHARLRLLVAGESGFQRGTKAAMIAAVQQTLTGTKSVTIQERDGGAYLLTVITNASETPSTAAALAALLTQKPAGIILTYATVAGATYLLIRASYATYTAVRSAFVTYTGLRNNIPGT